MGKIEKLAKINSFKLKYSVFGFYRCILNVLVMFPDRNIYDITFSSSFINLQDVLNKDYLKIAKYVVDQKLNWYVPFNELITTDQVDFSYFEKYETIKD
jgi:hypothetical protein